MIKIAILSQKGGCGKSTVAIHLAVASALAGKNTAIIDLDPQISATKWGDRRENGLPVVISIQAARLRKELDKVRDLGGELVIIDSAPHSDSAAIEAARVADLIIVPSRATILDLEAVQNTLGLVAVAKKPALVLLNGTNPFGNETESARELLRENGVDVCPVSFGNRVAFARSLISGQTAQELEPDGKAAMEVASLHDCIVATLQNVELGVAS